MVICRTDRLPFKWAIYTRQFEGCLTYVCIQLYFTLPISAIWPKQKDVLTKCMVPVLQILKHTRYKEHTKHRFATTLPLQPSPASSRLRKHLETLNKRTHSPDHWRHS